jgi:sigma-54 specific flagellar transcriptional regulator A
MSAALAEVLVPADTQFAAHETPSGVLVAFRRAALSASRDKIVGHHPTLAAAFEMIDRVAQSSCTVLVSGESGTGKELFVAALHEASPRTEAPLVVINCGAIPEALIESELFGHARGAFTGAHAIRRGRVAEAEGGTLFLDEIGELPLAMQVKLLRLLQQREYSPVGDSRTVKCNIRVVVATHRNLEQEVDNGRFREDLYYRLNVIHLELPALRERASDVGTLAEHFFRICSERARRDDLKGFTPAAIEAMVAYGWPGNVRELENSVERAVLLAIGPLVDVDDLPPRVRRQRSFPPAATTRALPDGGLDFRATIERYENNLIRQALERTGGNKNRAAMLLQVNRTTLVEMIKRKRIGWAASRTSLVRPRPRLRLHA